MEQLKAELVKAYADTKFTEREQLRQFFVPQKADEKPSDEGVENRIEVSCGITGTRINVWNFETKQSVYGHHMYVNRNVALSGFMWLKCLGTYVKEDDPILVDRVVHTKGGHYLKENEDTLVENDELVYAEDTGRFIFRDSAIWVADLDENWEHTDDLAYINGREEWVTEDYAYDNYYRHDDGEWYTYAEENYDEDSENGLSSYEAKADSAFGFFTDKGHSNKPEGKTMYFGLELEYEFTDYDGYDCETTANQTARQHNFLACSDGSLDEGFELKSAPMTFNRVKRAVTEVLADLKRNVEFEGAETCGVHIHVSRNALTDLQIGTIQEFLYAKDNYDFINFVADRSPNTYCSRPFDKYSKTGRLKSKHQYDPKTDTVKRILYHGYGEEGHYESFNTMNQATVEFRIFAGSSNVKVIHSYIEFVKALIELSSASYREQKLDVDAFLRHVRKYRKNFPNLFERVQSYAKKEGKGQIVDITTRMPRRIKGQRSAA